MKYSIPIRNLLLLFGFFQFTTADHCPYYPGYPDTSYFVTTSCTSTCCRGYSSSPNGACCTYSYHISDAWLVLPIIGGIVIFLSVLTIICCACRFDSNLRDKTTAFLSGEKPPGDNRRPKSIGSRLFEAQTGMEL